MPVMALIATKLKGSGARLSLVDFGLPLSTTSSFLLGLGEGESETSSSAVGRLSVKRGSFFSLEARRRGA
ncbi:hypothetical protein GOBAR_DD06130 [Gossypium barbadense]|nr:hypothetical protein GOBAR_DD06130 [Gossypium barbadense]